ncbi:MAG: ROK family protein [Protaetiibacter sp.]
MSRTARRFDALGPGDVLELIRSGMATTRRDILEITGLSRVTVASRIDALITAGILREEGSEGSTGGRRPAVLAFNPSHRELVCATVDTTHSVVARLDLDGTVLERTTLEIDVQAGPATVLEAVLDAAVDLVSRAASPLGGVGISLPAPIDPHTSRPSQPPMLPGWDAFPVAETIRDRLDVPVVVENDADMLALGEHARRFPTLDALVLAKVDTGIGTGLILGGRQYRGIDGGAGDIGHVKVAEAAELVCQCGASGCLAAIASGRAVAAQLAALGHDTRSGHEVATLVRSGEVDAIRLTAEAGRRIGTVLATVVNVINPGVVLVGGGLATTPLLAGIRETLYPRSLARSTRHLLVQLSELGSDAGLIGLAREQVLRQYSPEALNRALA